MRRLCVFCGSSRGSRAEYRDAARRFGELLAGRGVGLVFGAGHVGLMGVLADAVLQGGGEAIGVIPQALVDKELAHNGLTELRVVATMHQRRSLVRLIPFLSKDLRLLSIFCFFQLGMPIKALYNSCGSEPRVSPGSRILQGLRKEAPFLFTPL